MVFGGVVGCEPVEVQGKTGLLVGVVGWVFCKVGGWGLRGLVGGYVGVMVGGGFVDVLWHVVMVVSLCTCVYSAGLFSFCLSGRWEKISKSHEAGCWNLFSEFLFGVQFAF